MLKRQIGPGSRVRVEYDGEPLWYVRLVLAWVDAAEYVVWTLDSDVLLEQFD